MNIELKEALDSILQLLQKNANNKWKNNNNRF